jgi:hypothetical protein
VGRAAQGRAQRDRHNLSKRAEQIVHSAGEQAIKLFAGDRNRTAGAPGITVAVGW